jgi:acyl carrier protein
VAYVVAHEGKAPTIGELRKHVSERLPAHMVPAAIISLDRLPMTASGKVNRLALPETDVAPLEAGSVLQSPRTPTEEMLASIWSDILKLENVSIHDSFFDLGGHSLLATQVMSRVRQVFQVEVPLRRLFETPTIAELAEFIDSALLQSRGLPVPSIQPVSRLDPLPLSFSQQRLWFVEQLEPDSQVFIVARALLMRGRLRHAALEQSLNEVVRRHEILRTTIAVNQGQPVQVINPSSTLSIEVVDLKSAPRDEIERECKRLAGEESARRFDLRRGPLLRVRLLEVGAEEQVILLTMHHMVTDNWSTGVLIKELKRHYEAYIKGDRAELEELKIQYADYAVWQREWLKGEVLEEQAGYWKRQLAGAPPVLELPTDWPRPAERTFRCARESFMLPRDLSRGLSKLSQREGVTMFMTLLAALQTLFYRYTGQEDICIGSGIANRTRAEVEELIGYLVNIIVLRTDLRGNPRFDELLGRVREVTKGAYEHQELPFEQIVDLLQPERNLSYAPMAQVTFALQNAPMERLDLPDLSLEVIELDSQTVEYDISLLMSGNADGLGGLLIYNSDLFEASTIRRMIEHFQMILEEVVAEPEVRLLRIKLKQGEEELESEYSVLSGDEAEHFTFGLQG